MLKYVDTKVVFAEIPDEITLAINLSNCPCHCQNCHSSYLAKDIGEVLTITRLEKLLKQNKGVTTICFMGGDNDPKLVNHYAKLLKEIKVEKVILDTNLPSDIDIPKKDVHLKKDSPFKIVEYVRTPVKVGWYSGRQELSHNIDLSNFDFIKLGPYIEEYGPLNSRTTNQRFYKVVHTSTGVNKLIDITHKFWRHETEN